MILKFGEFILEHSKNDPIPEISEKKDKLGIILLGTPGLGKSYFINNFIQPRQEIKSFSTDDVSLRFTKDPQRYHQGSAELNVRNLLQFIDSGNSFIYDTTGTQPDQIFKIVQKSKRQGYYIMFVHLVGTLEQSLRQNLSRSRQVDPEYIEFSYNTQFSNMKTYFEQLNPDAYYVVYNKEGKYKFYKYVGGKLLKRKVNTYVEI